MSRPLKKSIVLRSFDNSILGKSTTATAVVAKEVAKEADVVATAANSNINNRNDNNALSANQSSNRASPAASSLSAVGKATNNSVSPKAAGKGKVGTAAVTMAKMSNNNNIKEVGMKKNVGMVVVGDGAQAAVVDKGGAILVGGGVSEKGEEVEKVKTNHQVVKAGGGNLHAAYQHANAAAAQAVPLPPQAAQQGNSLPPTAGKEMATAAQQIQSKNVKNANTVMAGGTQGSAAAATQGGAQGNPNGKGGYNHNTKTATAQQQHYHHHQWTQQQQQHAYADYYKQYQQQVAAYNQAQQQQQEKKNKDGSTTSGVGKGGTKDGSKPVNVESNDQANKKSSSLLDGEKKKDGDDTKSSTGDEKKKEGDDDDSKKAPLVTTTTHPPLHHHQQQHYHYAAWHAHHQAAAARAWHQQQQQGKGQVGQQQPPHYYPYWSGYQHPHAAYQHHAQQQQQLAAARGGTVLPVAHQGAGQGNINCATVVEGRIERKKVKATKQEFAPPKNIQSNKQHRRMDSKSSKSLSVSSSMTLSKKRSREESFDRGEGRDDLNTKSLSLSDDQDTDNVSTSGLSLGGFSLGSLGRLSESPNKRRKGQSIHRMDDCASSTLSDEGKMILKTLSINASYSAEFADLYNDPSPMNASNNSDVNISTDEKSVSFDEGLTPKKCNTSNKKKRTVVINTSLNEDSPTMLDLIGGAETPTTGMLMNSIMESALKDDESSLNAHLRGQTFTPLPIMMSDNVADHHGPPTGRSEASAIMAMMGMGNSSGDLSITPQLSWGMMDGNSPPGSSSPLEITPRCFGLLDSTKSSRSDNFHPLGSPKSFWKDSVLNKSATSMDSNGSSSKKKSILSILSPTMRAMKVAEDGREEGSHQKGEPATPSTSPLPFHNNSTVGQQDENSNNQGGDSVLKSILKTDPKTPMRKSTIHDDGNNPAAAAPNSAVISAQSTTVVPVMQHAHGSTSPWGDYLKPNGGSGSFAPSPIPPILGGAQSPYGYHPNMFYPHQQLDHQGGGAEGGVGGDSKDEHDRVRNLRGNGPPRHQLPPSHNLPPPSYHHFSPLTTNFPGHYSSPYPPHLMPNQLDMMGGGGGIIGGGVDSSRKCIPIKHPLPQKFQGDIDKFKNVQLPDFNNLVNFPGHMTKNPSNVPDGMRCCVMCGQACKCTKVGKGNAKGGFTNHGPGTPQPIVVSSCSSNNIMAVNVMPQPLGDSSKSSSNSPNNSNIPNNNNYTPPMKHQNPYQSKANIPTQNKGLCTICDVNVWMVISTGLEIKWCKGCKNFKPWAAFGEKGLATKCVKCRARQREKYLYTKSGGGTLNNSNSNSSGVKNKKKGSGGIGGLSVNKNKSVSPKKNDNVVNVGGEIGSL